ncbi:MAG: hypothetical protein WDZ93_01270 [Candidatus Paceibacterota bacterium]
MREKHDDKRLDALRERLYARGEAPKRKTRAELKDIKQDVPTDWEQPAAEPSADIPPEIPADTSPTDTMGKRKQKYSYRAKILLTAICFFVAAVLLSSLFIAFGGNSISGDNIVIDLNGPFTVAGGEEMAIQVGVTNRNSVAIESATLIVEYPDGTQSATEEGRQLFIDRIPLDSIGSGETVNVPLRARIFGEENEELMVNASVEYRVSGSNATFFKEAEPLRFKVGSSPVSLEIETVERVASGQEVTIELTVHSNATTRLTDLLVQASFPSGFDFTRSSPSPISGQNTWAIDVLEPEESATIELSGVLIGGEEEERVMHFSVGVPNENDRYSLGSTLSTLSQEFTIEQAFLDVAITIGGSSELSIEPGRQSNVQVKIENTLDEAIYDGVVEVKLTGNALSDVAITSTSGYYDSNSRTITWDSSSESRLDQLGPGDTHTVRFSMTPDTDALRTPQINAEVSVRARRVRESQVSDSLVGSTRATIKVASVARLVSSTGHESGPVPPEVGDTTVYELSLRAEGGSNDIGGAVVSATLPSYVTWLDATSGDGTITFSPSTRTVEWNIGNIDANRSVDATFDVSILPSASQIDTTPTLMSQQQFRGEDRFTGTVIRTTSPALTTEMEESGFGSRNGRVQE